MCELNEELYFVTLCKEAGLDNGEIQAMRQMASRMARLRKLRVIPEDLLSPSESRELTEIRAHLLPTEEYKAGMDKLAVYHTRQTADAVSKFQQSQGQLRVEFAAAEG